MVGPAAASTPKKSGWERAVAKFSVYFEERGLGPQDIPPAIIIHEVSCDWPFGRDTKPACSGCRRLHSWGARSKCQVKGGLLSGAGSGPLHGDWILDGECADGFPPQAAQSFATTYQPSVIAAAAGLLRCTALQNRGPPADDGNRQQQACSSSTAGVRCGNAAGDCHRAEAELAEQGGHTRQGCPVFGGGTCRQAVTQRQPEGSN